MNATRATRTTPSAPSQAVVWLLTTLALASGASAQEEAYDASALLDHVRAEERTALASELGVSSLARLPLYDLHVAIDDRLRGFGLRETVVVTNTEAGPWRDVAMRIFVNATVAPGSEPLVRFLEGRCLDGASCEFEQPSPSVILVRPSAPLAPGAHLRFELDLQGRMPELEDDRLSMMGQGLESLATLEGAQSATPGDYGLVAHGAGIGSLASFYPVLARRRRARASSEWITDDGGTTGDLSTDLPHHVRARVVVPEDVVVASSGVEVGVADVADAPGRAPRKEITIHAAAVRELAILVSPRFVTSECSVLGTRVRSFFLMRDGDAGRHVGDVACEAFRVFSRRFGPYPYTELDVVEAPLVGGAGGVEFSGLVTVALMFYRSAMEGGSGALGILGALGALGGEEGTDPSGGLDQLAEMSASMREFVTAHEVAHQWWHGLVGSDSREHPWVDESLAQYSAMLYVEDRHGAARAREEGERQVAMNFHMMRIQGRADDIVDRPASAFGAPIAYAGLVYGKGPFFYRAVRERVGDQAFFAGLARYVREHRFREASSEAVVDALASESGGHASEVRRLARRWLHERHGDEDLGPSDPAAVMRSVMPPELAGALEDPTMGPILQQMLGSMLGGAGAGGGGGGGDGELPPELGELFGGGSIDEDAIRRRLGEIEDQAGERAVEGPDASVPRVRHPAPRRAR